MDSDPSDDDDRSACVAPQSTSASSKFHMWYISTLRSFTQQSAVLYVCGYKWYKIWIQKLKSAQFFVCKLTAFNIALFNIIHTPTCDANAGLHHMHTAMCDHYVRDMRRLGCKEKSTDTCARKMRNKRMSTSSNIHLNRSMQRTLWYMEVVQ